MNIRRIIRLTELVRLSDEIHVVNYTELIILKYIGDANLSDAEEYIWDKQTEILYDGRHGWNTEALRNYKVHQ